MKIIEIENGIKIKNLEDFEPKHIFECGQCFRWNKQEDESYIGVYNSKVLKVYKKDNDIYFMNTNKEDFEKIWAEYFDLDTDYKKLKNDLANMDKYLKKSVEFGYGLRILKQDIYEMMISFIISARNSIPNIKKTVERICEKYGQKIETFEGKTYYAFPSPKDLAFITEEELKECKTSFRTKYIIDTSKKIIEENIKLQELKKLNDIKLEEQLREFAGIGPKVSNCIMLFAFYRKNAFPVDVWVKRVMEEFYLDEDMNLNKMKDYGVKLFNPYAGFAQQYLFYYARELGIGKKK